MEGKISNEHIDIMWQAAQLKHCSKQVHDLLPPLIKHLEARPVLHLYSLLCKLEPKDHTEQVCWNIKLCFHCKENILQYSMLFNFQNSTKKQKYKYFANFYVVTELIPSLGSHQIHLELKWRWWHVWSSRAWFG